MDIGQSFSPTQGATVYGQNGQSNRVGSGSSPVMDAIKILSFRVPQTLGVGSPVAPGLLAGAGGATPGMGGDNGALLQQWLQRFFGQGLAQAGQIAPAGAPTSAPNALPGMGAANPFVQNPSQPGSDMAPGAALPGATRPAIQFPAAPVPGQDANAAPTFGDIGGARRTMGPPSYTPPLDQSMGSGAGGFSTPSMQPDNAQQF